MQIIQGLLIAAALIAIVLLLFVALGLLAFGIAADVMRQIGRASCRERVSSPV